MLAMRRLRKPLPTCFRWVSVVLCLLLHWFWVPSALAQQTPKVFIEPRPAWVNVSSQRGTREPEADGGVAVLHLERQVNYERGSSARYVAGEMKVTTQAGATSLGERTFEWNPSHERLVLHTLSIRRDGVVTSHLAAKDIQVLHREARLEKNLYDGARTAVIILSDLRVGDVLSYEYSVIGQNPVLDGHYADGIGQSVPIAVGSYRVRIVSDRPLYTKAFHGAKVPQQTVQGNVTSYDWHQLDLPASRVDDGTPAGESGVPWVELSDFASWREVASWGNKLFKLPAATKELDDWRRVIAGASQDETARALLALRRVQEEIRYLSLSFAESSHRPAQPAVVLQRRFGDCKDKSLLAVALLRALGIEAHVALVSTTAGKSISQRLPSIEAFDHAIVRVRADGKEWWFDPTLLYQRGGATEVTVDAYPAALVLEESTEALTTIDPVAHAQADVYAVASYSLPEWGGPGTLELITTFRHGYAQSIRSAHAAKSATDFARAISEGVTAQHPLASLKDTKVDDDEAENQLRIAQTFDLPAKSWSGEAPSYAFELSPIWLSNVVASAAVDRVSPLSLTHPVRMVHDVRIDAPEPIAVEKTSGAADSAFWRLDWKAQSGGNRITLHYDFTTKTDIVQAADLGGYRDATAALSVEASFHISKQPPRLPPALTGGPAFSLTAALAIVVVWTLAMVGGAFWLQRKQPWLQRPNIPYTPSLVGRKGWLALLALPVSIAPIRLVLDSFRLFEGVLDRDTWNGLTNPASAVYSAAWAPVSCSPRCAPTRHASSASGGWLICIGRSGAAFPSRSSASASSMASCCSSTRSPLVPCCRIRRRATSRCRASPASRRGAPMCSGHAVCVPLFCPTSRLPRSQSGATSRPRLVRPQPARATSLPHRGRGERDRGERARPPTNRRKVLEEGKRFELLVPFGTAVFKTGSVCSRMRLRSA